MVARGLFIFLFVSFFSGCGGGGSSSGGGANIPPAPAFSVGRYGGTQTLTLSFPSRPDIAPDTQAVGFVAEVSSNSIRILDADLTNSTSSLDAAGNFGIPGAELTLTLDDGTLCMGRLAFNGRVTGTSLTGNIVGSINCAGVTLSIDGSFIATLGAPAGKFSGSGLLETVLEYLDRAW